MAAPWAAGRRWPIRAFKLDEAFARFRKGYTPAHFAGEEAGSVRGSRRGEMIARCVVESGTSSYYSAIRDASEEPVLAEIAGRIAADEYRHYKLFYDILNAQAEPDIGFWRKLWIAVGRVRESDDDELAYAFYCANVPSEQEAAKPYERKTYSRMSANASVSVYHRKHIQKLVQMVVKVVGADPHGWLANMAGALFGAASTAAPPRHGPFGRGGVARRSWTHLSTSLLAPGQRPKILVPRSPTGSKAPVLSLRISSRPEATPK